MNFATLISLAINYGPEAISLIETYGPLAVKAVKALAPIVKEAVAKSPADTHLSQVNNVLASLNHAPVTEKDLPVYDVAKGSGW